MQRIRLHGPADAELQAGRELQLIDDIAKDAQDAQALRRLLQDVSDDFGLGDIAETMEHLHNINRHLGRYLTTPNFNPFSRYVARIKAVFEEATGKPARVATPTENTINLSQFVVAMKKLDRNLPPQARRKNDPTDVAWSRAVYDAIQTAK